MGIPEQDVSAGIQVVFTYLTRNFSSISVQLIDPQDCDDKYRKTRSFYLNGEAPQRILFSRDFLDRQPNFIQKDLDKWKGELHEYITKADRVCILVTTEGIQWA